MSMLQLVGGVAAAGVVAAGTTALTGTGVSWGGTGTGTAAQYVGGTLTQTVSGGASITGITYTTTSSSATSVNDQVTAIAITLTGANGAYLTVTPSQSGGGLGGSADNWNCTGHVATGATGEAPIHPTAPKVKINNATATVTCNTWNSAAGPAANGGYYTGLTGVALAVTNS